VTEAVETVVEQTIDAMRAAIREGRYAQGQRLVVAEVTKALGVSAGPVREAIRRLTGEGLVEITPHVGASVRAFKSRDVREIFQLREVVEGLAARLAAEHVTFGDHRVALETSLAEMRRIIAARGAGYIEHNHDFHELIYRMAGSGRVRETAAQLVLPIYQMRFHYLMRVDDARASAAEHELIAEAIFEGDATRAERMMRNHIRNSGVAMLEAMETHDAKRRDS
jgi:DNA-binding GntR family transcriptional regulator